MPTTRLTDDEFALFMTPPILAPRGEYLSVAERTEVFSSSIFNLVITDFQTLGIVAFVYNIASVTGDLADIEDGMTVDFGTTAGARDIGTARIRGVPTLGLIFINEIAPAKLKLTDGIFFTVRDEFKPHLILPLGRGTAVGASYTNTIQMFKDYDLAYTDQNKFFTPKANITRSATKKIAPKPAGFVDDWKKSTQKVYRTLTLSAALSFSLSAAISSVLWNVKDCTIISGSSTTATITIRIPVGYRNIRLTVTSADGKSGTRVFPLWAHDETYMPLSRFQITRNYTKDWREIELDFFQQDTSETTIPKGTTLCLWEHDPLWGRDVPDQYRDQMYGWATQEITLFRKYRPHATVSITGLGEWLDRYRAIPQRIFDPITRDSSSWFEMRNIYLDKLVFFLCDNFSNANLIGNLFLSGETDLLKSLDITGQSLFDQMRYSVAGYYGEVRCRSLNDLVVEKTKHYMTAAERSGIEPVFDATPANWTDDDPLKITEREYDVVAAVHGAGASFDGSVNTLYNSAAPGRTPGDSNTEQDAPGQNLPSTNSQDVLQQLTAARFLVLNNPRDNEALNLLQNLDVLEPGDLISVTTSDSLSGLILDHDPFLVKEINISYDDPTATRGKKISLSLEGLVPPTTKDDAQEVDVPVDTTTPIDETPPQDIEVVPSVPPDPIPPETGAVPAKGWGISANESKSVLITAFNPSTGVVTYADRNTGLAGNGIDGYSDPFHYLRAFAGMDLGIYKCDDIENFTSFSQIKSNTGLFGASNRILHILKGSHLHKGWGMAVSGTNVIAVTFDYWNTVTVVSINGAALDYGTGLTGDQKASVWICGHNADHLIALVPSASSAGASGLYRSTDGGLTWALLVSLDTVSSPSDGYYLDRYRQFIEVPYKRSDGSNNLDDSSLELTVQFGGDNHSSNTTVTLMQILDKTGTSHGGHFGNAPMQTNSTASHPLTTFTHTSSHVWFADGDSISRTTDHFATIQSSLVTITGGEGAISVNGWPENRDCAIGCSRNYVPGIIVMRFTFDGGVTWYGSNPPSWATPAFAYLEFSLYPVIHN